MKYYNLEIDIDYNEMAQVIEFENRAGRYEAGLLHERDEFWPQWGDSWTRDSNGIAIIDTDDSDVAF